MSSGLDKAQYAVAHDGRFLVSQTLEESTAAPITLVQNRNPDAKT